MIAVDEALARILAAASPLPAELVMLSEAHGRVLAADVVSRRTQPPSAVSAMDGYAVRGADVAHAPVRLRQIGAVAAGARFDGTIGAGETVRIFTGAPLPDGADTIVIQENVRAEGEAITVLEAERPARFVRRAGLDFSAGDTGVRSGRRLGARDIGLAAAMNVPWLSVRRRPVVGLLATGDEIALPGDPLGEGQIVSSNGPALAAFVARCGGLPVTLGIAADSEASLGSFLDAAAGCDVLVTTGGASVGEHDLVQAALEARGLDLDFWQIAMRPGKPLMFGRLERMLVLGLPGNPVSSMVCALLFLRPLLGRLAGLAVTDAPRAAARLAVALPGNDHRQDYLRAVLRRDADGVPVAEPFEIQDSSMLAALTRADALIVRPPHAPPAEPGAMVEIVPLDDV